MLKRKSLILFAAVIATIALFAAGEALAFNDDACYGWNYEGSNAGGCTEPARSYTDEVSGFKMTLSDGYPKLWGGTCSVASTCYEWQYEVTTPGLGFVAWLIPDCCTTPAIDFDLEHFIPGNLDYRPVGAGETEVNFGMYNNTARVLKGPTPDSTSTYRFVSTTNNVTSSAVIAKVKRWGVLAFEMAVPGCFPAPEPPCVPQLDAGQSNVRYIGAALEVEDQEVPPNKSNFNLCVEVLDAAACVANLYAAECTDPDNFGDPIGSTLWDPPAVPIGDGHIVGFTGSLTGSALCDTGAIELNAGCYVVYIGGRPVAYIPTGCK